MEKTNWNNRDLLSSVRIHFWPYWHGYILYFSDTLLYLFYQSNIFVEIATSKTHAYFLTRSFNKVGFAEWNLLLDVAAMNVERIVFRIENTNDMFQRRSRVHLGSYLICDFTEFTRLSYLNFICARERRGGYCAPYDFTFRVKSWSTNKSRRIIHSIFYCTHENNDDITHARYVLRSYHDRDSAY